jgi:hypothetical protein
LFGNSHRFPRCEATVAASVRTALDTAKNYNTKLGYWKVKERRESGEDKREKVSVAEVVRRAISSYLEEQKKK